MKVVVLDHLHFVLFEFYSFGIEERWVLCVLMNERMNLIVYLFF